MSQAADGEIASRAFRIVGIFQAETEAVEKQYVFTSLAAAQQMLGLDGDICEVAILLPDRTRVDQLANELQTALGTDQLQVSTWRQLLPLVTAVLKMYDGFIYIWFVTVFVAMGFGLVNTILMAVFERIREFGLLRSLGMKPGLVVYEVLTESFFLLVIGAVVGNLLGFITTAALARTGIDLSAFAAGMEFVGMSRIIIPVIYTKDIVSANATVLILGLLVSLYPAVKASRINPIEAMAQT
jgi:ABC-type lipoprotein release transport system permease subunit